MKKQLLLSLFLLVSTLSIGQFNFGAGAQLILDGSVLGVQGKALYEIDETWRASGTFTLHFEESINWTIDLDAHYKLLELSEKFDIAPIGGLSITSFSTGFGSGTEIGLNLGAFIDFVPSDSYHIYIEPKLNIAGYESFAISGGILF